jgi:hypothetical protein
LHFFFNFVWNFVKSIGDYRWLSHRCFFKTSSFVSRQEKKHQYCYRNRKYFCLRY